MQKLSNENSISQHFVPTDSPNRSIVMMREDRKWTAKMSPRRAPRRNVSLRRALRPDAGVRGWPSSRHPPIRPSPWIPSWTRIPWWTRSRRTLSSRRRTLSPCRAAWCFVRKCTIRWSSKSLDQVTVIVSRHCCTTGRLFVFFSMVTGFLFSKTFLLFTHLNTW